MSIQFPARSLPILNRCDVLVLDCGFTGMAAALRLSAAGHAVTIVEPRTYPGRELTAKGRPFLKPGEYDGNPPEPLATALAAALDAERGGIWTLHEGFLKQALEDTLRQAGVTLYYATLPVGVIRAADGGVGAVLVGNKSGRQAIPCKFVVDTTETALMARLLDLPFMASASHARYRRRLEFTQVDGLDACRLDCPVEGVEPILTLYPGLGGEGHCHLEYEVMLERHGDSALEATRRDMEARRRGVALVEWLKRNHAAFRNALWAASSHELEGPFTTPPAGDGDQSALPLIHLCARDGLEALELPGSCFATPVPRLLLASAAARTPAGVALNLTHLPRACDLGLAVVDLVQVPRAHPPLEEAPCQIVTPSALALREQPVPQRGVAYDHLAASAREIESIQTYDVLVVGGGTSGAIASITAGRSGLQTGLIDMNPGLGGTGTYGGIHAYWFGYRGGFSGQVTSLVDAMHTRTGHPRQRGDIPRWNIECKIHALLEGAEEAQVSPLLNSMFIGTLVEDRTVRGVVIATRYGPLALMGTVTIDATGDGDVAAAAGAPYVLGSQRDHSMMYSYMAQMIRPGRPRNVKTRSVDVTNVEDYTRGIMAERRSRQAGDVDHGIYLAPRESRHIQADITLTLTDQLVRRAFPDVIAVMFSNNDIKGQSTSDWILMGLQSPHLDMEIPWRALLPVGLDRIIVSGKAFSATHDALAAPRMQPDMENLGGVAAVAAALAIQRGESPRELAVRPLQEKLVEAGVLPARILRRSLKPLRFSDAQRARAWARIDADVPLHSYSRMENNRRYEGRVDVADLLCSGPETVPFLRGRHAAATGSAKVLLAQLLAVLGSPAGVDTLVAACLAQLRGDRLPEQTDTIMYKGIPPDQNAAPHVASLIYSLGLTRTRKALPVWRRVVELLRHETAETVMDRDRAMYYYVPAVCFGMERLGNPACVDMLRQLHAYAPFNGHRIADATQLGADYVAERLAYLEILVGRCLARCGSPEGYLILIDYLRDARAIHTEHALTELIRITGQDHGKDQAKWSDWLERHGERLPVAPYTAVSDPVRAWDEDILIDPLHEQSASRPIGLPAV